MGTRSTIKFRNEGCDPIVCIYQQFDGYIDGVGHELAEWLSKMVLINGISKKEHYTWNYANGAGCLVAKFIHDFKDRTGNLYIEDIGAKEDYNYTVTIKSRTIGTMSDEISAEDGITIEVETLGETIFTGTPKELLAFDEYEDED